MNRNKALLPLLLIFAFTAFSQTLPQGVRKITAVEGITEYALPNGLHVLLFPDSSKPNVTVNMTYMVGSRHEGYGETGMAHLLEHMLFLQTKTRKDVKQELKDHGAEMNGSTSWDRTNYFETLNATDENLKFALELEADRMVNSKIEKPLLDTEMTVVRNEFEMGENSPDRILMQRALETAYTWHNYGKLPIGNRSDIENVPINKLASFYQKYYQPDNALLTIAGKFDETKTLAHGGQPLRRHPQTHPHAREVLYRRTHPGWRTLHHPAPRRRYPGHRGHLSRLPPDPTPTTPRSTSSPASSATVPRAASTRPSSITRRPSAPPWEWRTCMTRASSSFPPASRLDQSLDEARQILLKTVEGVARRTAHQGRGGARQDPPAEEYRTGNERFPGRRARSQRVRLAGRLAPHVPHARPHHRRSPRPMSSASPRRT